MPAKKKKRTQKDELRVRKSAVAALDSLTAADTRPVLDELARLREYAEDLRQKLVAAEQALDGAKMLVQVQSDTISRHVPELVELSEKLAEVQKRLIAEKHELRKQLAAEKTSVEFWTYEASRWRTEAEDLRRGEAVSRVERGVS